MSKKNKQKKRKNKMVRLKNTRMKKSDEEPMKTRSLVVGFVCEFQIPGEMYSGLICVKGTSTYNVFR